MSAVRSGATLPVEDPSTGEEIARSPRGDAVDVDDAVAAARAAAGPAREATPAERGRALRRLVAALDAAAEAGYVMINEYFAGGPSVPFGGTKRSGAGRERGLVALESYVRLKTVVARVRRGEPGR